MDVKCHGSHGWLGEGGNGPTLVQFGRTIAHDKFIDRVLHGKAGMPPFDTVLNEEDVHQIIDWLEKIPQ
ncbi:cytochrome c [Nitrospira defluvii]|nr:cytochrome c [Nitrospira defluvii]